MEPNDLIVRPDALILVTGAAGFIGSRVVASLVNSGLRNLRCFVRHSSLKGRVEALRGYNQNGTRVEVMEGNLLSRQDCEAATRKASVIVHLAAGVGEKSFPDAVMNCVVITRNLLEASVGHGCLKRFVNVSSFSVYSNSRKPQLRLLDESCPVEEHSELRGEAYCFAKVKQDEIVREYGANFGVPYVIVRPGYVIGPGKKTITSRVGLDTFGVFLHLGGANRIPFTYVDNCADAIALAGVKKGVDGEVFNIVDDDLPSSREFLRLYKRNVKRFNSIYLPHSLSYAFCYLWERYSAWSAGQLPPAFNRRKWHAYWKSTRYSNARLKDQLGWNPKVPMTEGLRRYFEACSNGDAHA